MRRTVLICLVSICVLLSACDASEPNNLFGVSNDQIGSTMESQDLRVSIQDHIASSTTELAYYPYGNMQKNVPSGNFVRIGDEILFVWAGENYGRVMLYTFDLNTNSISTFCKDATCTHLDASCAAGGAIQNLEPYNGTVYALSQNGSILKLVGDRFTPIVDGGVSHFWHSGDRLYVQTKDSSLMVYEDERDEPKMLIEDYTGYWETIFDGKLYYQFSGIHCVDLDADIPQSKTILNHVQHVVDGESIYYASDNDLHLYRMSMDGSDPELLLDQPILPASWNFDDKSFYFRLYLGDKMDGEYSGDIYRIKKDDPQSIEKIAELPIPAYQIYTVENCDFLFITAYEPKDNPSFFLVSKDGTSEPQLISTNDF